MSDVLPVNIGDSVTIFLANYFPIICNIDDIDDKFIYLSNGSKADIYTGNIYNPETEETLAYIVYPPVTNQGNNNLPPPPFPID